MTSDEIAVVDQEKILALVMSRVGATVRPLWSNPNCRTCQSPYRLEIEQMISVQQLSYRGIERWLVNKPRGHMPHPSREALSRHAREDMGTAEFNRRIIAERRAHQVSQGIEGEGGILDYVSSAETIVQIGMERVASGEIKPDVKDIIAAGSLLYKVNSDMGNGGVTHEAMQVALNEYMRVAEDFIDPDHQQAYAERLANNPILKALYKQIHDPDVVDVQSA